MSIDKLKTKFFTGAWLTDVKHYFNKINEIIDYQKPLDISTNFSNVIWNINKNYNVKLILNSNKTLNIENLTSGDYGTILLIQDNIGSKTITLPSNSVVMGTQGSSNLTLSSNANYVDIATFYYDGNNLYWTISTY